MAALWKPRYRHSTWNGNGSIITNRATRMTHIRIGERVSVYSGIRFVPVTMTADRVGHAIGEFVATRKRAIHPVKGKRKPRTAKKGAR